MNQKTAFEILKKGHNVFLTGPAGSGKTYLLNKFIEYLKKNGIPVAKTASTGIAATHMNGMTIHSWSGMGINRNMDEKQIKRLKGFRKMQRRFEKTEVLIIDEISMLHDYQLDLLNKICKSFKDPFLPFGGLQVILSGDFFQLPPVSKGDDPSRFVIYSGAWKEADPRVCYLDKLYRQRDENILRVLNDIRERNISRKTVELLNSRANSEIKGVENPTRLFTHNANVDELNHRELAKLEEEPLAYSMEEEGPENLVKGLKKSCLAPEKLRLKKGAKVMFVKNNFDKGYVNGTTGTVAGTNREGFPKVKTFEGREIQVMPESWIIEDETANVLASVRQVPLRLAWAITVHKSQGMTLDAVENGLSKSFEYGMGYVALSRCGKLEGMKLLGINRMALEVDPKVFEIDKLLKELSERREKHF